MIKYAFGCSPNAFLIQSYKTLYILLKYQLMHWNYLFPHLCPSRNGIFLKVRDLILAFFFHHLAEHMAHKKLSINICIGLHKRCSADLFLLSQPILLNIGKAVFSFPYCSHSKASTQ